MAIRGLDLGLISAQLAGTSRGVIEGDVAGVAEVRGRLRDVASLDGHLTVNRLLLRSSGVELQNASALHWQLAQGVLRFEAVRLQGQGSALTVRGLVHLPETRLDVTVVGTGPVAMVGARIPGVRFQQGVVEAQVKIGGTLGVPVFAGQTRIRDGAIYIAAINENLAQLQGEIQFAGQTIAIRSLQGDLAGGRVEVAGEVRLRGLRLHDISLTGQVKRVRLRYPTGFFAVLDAEVVVTGNGERQQLTGEASLAHARYRRDIDLASLLRQYRQRVLEPPSIAQESVRLDIRVSTQDPLRVESRVVKLRATPDLHVRGSLNRPVVLGRVDIEEGTADIGGTRFTAVSGSVDFLNPMRTEPFFDISADSRKNGYQIHVIATGTPQQFDLNLTSEPALAETDILALLTVGATGQAITAGVGTVVPQRLSSFLTGQMAAEVSRGVGGIVGIDRLDIEPVVGDAQRVGGPKITLGKDVSRDLSVTYSTIVGSTQEDLVTVEYRLTDSISILGIRDERGDVGVDVKFSFRFE
jgi:translocation and assembly module TamB